MNDPLVTAAQHLYTAFQEDPNRANLIHLISDGHANSGVTNADDINTNFRNAQGNIPIVMNTYSVGSNANNGLLSKLTVFNTGRLHYISDETVNDFGLSDELTITYLHYRCPILSNVNFNYPDGSVDQLTITGFPYLFKGQELAVSGRILSGEDDFIRMTITGVIGSGRTITWRRIISMRLVNQREHSCLIDRLSAYMEVKQTLEKYSYYPTQEIKNKLIELSKQNHLVTALTSLLVSESSQEACACPDECICNTQCPSSQALSGDNVAGNSLSPSPPGGSTRTSWSTRGFTRTARRIHQEVRPGPVGPPGGSPGPVGSPGGSPGPVHQEVGQLDHQEVRQDQLVPKGHQDQLVQQVQLAHQDHQVRVKIVHKEDSDVSDNGDQYSHRILVKVNPMVVEFYISKL